MSLYVIFTRPDSLNPHSAFSSLQWGVAQGFRVLFTAGIYTVVQIYLSGAPDIAGNNLPMCKLRGIDHQEQARVIFR